MLTDHLFDHVISFTGTQLDAIRATDQHNAVGTLHYSTAEVYTLVTLNVHRLIPIQGDAQLIISVVIRATFKPDRDALALGELEGDLGVVLGGDDPDDVSVAGDKSGFSRHHVIVPAERILGYDLVRAA